MSHLSSLLTNSPFTVFLAVFLGVLVGQVEYRGFSLGSSGALFAGLGLGFLGFRVDHGYFSLSLVLFVAAIGLIAAEDIDNALTVHGLKFVTIGVTVTATAMVLTAALVVLLSDRLDPWLLRGSFFGTLTSSPGLAAAIESAPAGTRSTLQAGYSFTYLFGLVIVILFEEFAPLVLGLNMEAEREKYRNAIGQSLEPDSPTDGSVTFSLAGFSLAIVVGALIDQVHLPLGPLGTMTMSLGGGTLIAALVIGYFGHVGPIETRMSKPILSRIQEVALGIFLAVVGVEASATFVSTIATGGVILVLSTLVIGGGAILAGCLLALVVWDLSWISTAGAIAGGMTSTPALAAAITTTETEDVGTTYAAAYPFGLLGMVVFSKLLVLAA